MQEDKILNFIKHNERPFSMAGIIVTLILTWGFGIACGFLGAYAMFTRIFFILTNTIVTVIALRYADKETYLCQFLYYGTSFLNFSLIFLFASYKLFIGNEPKLWLLIICLLLHFMVLSLIAFITFRNIKNNAYTKTQQTQGKLLLFAGMGGTFGIMIARFTLINASQKTVYFVSAIIALLLALLTSTGIVYIIKYLLIKKYGFDEENELSDEC